MMDAAPFSFLPFRNVMLCHVNRGYPDSLSDLSSKLRTSTATIGYVSTTFAESRQVDMTLCHVYCRTVIDAVFATVLDLIGR